MGIYCTPEDDDDLFLLTIDANTVDYVILGKVAKPNHFNTGLNKVLG